MIAAIQNLETGPTASALDWILVAVSAAVVVYSLVAAIRYTLRPGETDRGHIKFTILEDD